jgi:3-hydroxyisobutyrate dehydrogenase-like beta-hydroxyacid dehydrogenase
MYQRSSYENGVAMPMENAAKETYAMAIRQGLGDMDFSAIYQFINESVDSESKE